MAQLDYQVNQRIFDTHQELSFIQRGQSFASQQSKAISIFQIYFGSLSQCQPVIGLFRQIGDALYVLYIESNAKPKAQDNLNCLIPPQKQFLLAKINKL